MYPQPGVGTETMGYHLVFEITDVEIDQMMGETTMLMKEKINLSTNNPSTACKHSLGPVSTSYIT
jgi:hypothetical protein